VWPKNRLYQQLRRQFPVQQYSCLTSSVIMGRPLLVVQVLLSHSCCSVNIERIAWHIHRLVLAAGLMEKQYRFYCLFCWVIGILWQTQQYWVKQRNVVQTVLCWDKWCDCSCSLCQQSVTDTSKSHKDNGIASIAWRMLDSVVGPHSLFPLS